MMDRDQPWRQYETMFKGADDVRLVDVLVVAAVAVDLVRYCGGTLLRLANRGARVDLVLATAGDRHSHDLSETDTLRRWEGEGGGRALADLLGVSEVRSLGRPELELDLVDLRTILVGEIRRLRPQVVIASDPAPLQRKHPDHRVTGQAVLDACWPWAGNAALRPDLGPPHQAKEAWLFGTASPDLFVPVAASRRALEQLGRRADAGVEEGFAQVDLRGPGGRAAAD
jgi:LmbE family N-acetylglucosaminyl deacetylase